MANPPNLIRKMVSGQRIRFTEDGYNLDLSYIGDRIIAMGYPADNVEAIYRNKRGDVVKFLKEKHPGCCKVYNLCSERAYDATLFQHYAEYPFKDHNPPDIELINKFCEDVDQFLRSDSRHVVAIHCKAGKGRTGTMICCYLLYSNAFQTANEALTYYAEKRTKDKKGVTIPSQRRYVEYYEQLLRGKPGNYQDVTLYICEIRISPADVPLKSGTIKVKGSKEAHPLTDFQRSDDYVTVQLNFCLPLTGDVKIEFACSKIQDKRWHFWFNTFFVERAGHYDSQNRLVLSLTKKEIDDAHKGNARRCPEQVIVFLRPVPTSERKNGEKQSSANRELATIPTTQQAPLVDSGNQNHHHHYYSHQQQQQQQLQQRHHLAQMESLTQSQQQHRSSVNNRSSMGGGQQNSCIYGNIGHPDNGGLLSIANPMGMKQQQQQQQAVYAIQQQPDAASASSPTRKLSYKNQQPPAVNKMPHKAPQQHHNNSGGSSEEISGTDSVEEEEREDDDDEEEEEEEEGWESGECQTVVVSDLCKSRPTATSTTTTTTPTSSAKSKTKPAQSSSTSSCVPSVPASTAPATTTTTATMTTNNANIMIPTKSCAFPSVSASRYYSDENYLLTGSRCLIRSSKGSGPLPPAGGTPADENCRGSSKHSFSPNTNSRTPQLVQFPSRTVPSNDLLPAVVCELTGGNGSTGADGDHSSGTVFCRGHPLRTTSIPLTGTTGIGERKKNDHRELMLYEPRSSLLPFPSGGTVDDDQELQESHILLSPPCLPNNSLPKGSSPSVATVPTGASGSAGDGAAACGGGSKLTTTWSSPPASSSLSPFRRFGMAMKRRKKKRGSLKLKHGAGGAAVTIGAGTGGSNPLYGSCASNLSAESRTRTNSGSAGVLVANNGTGGGRTRFRLLRNMRSNPSLKDTLVKSVKVRSVDMKHGERPEAEPLPSSACATQIPRSPTTSIPSGSGANPFARSTPDHGGRRPATDGGTSSKEIGSSNSNTNHPTDYYSFLCDNQLSYESPSKSPGHFLGGGLMGRRPSTIEEVLLSDSTATTTAVAAATATVECSVVVKPRATNVKIGFDVGPPAPSSLPVAETDAGSPTLESSFEIIDKCDIDDAMSNGVLPGAAATGPEDSNSPILARSNRCAPFSFREIRQELRAAMNWPPKRTQSAALASTVTADSSAVRSIERTLSAPVEVQSLSSVTTTTTTGGSSSITNSSTFAESSVPTLANRPLNRSLSERQLATIYHHKLPTIGQQHYHHFYYANHLLPFVDRPPKNYQFDKIHHNRKRSPACPTTGATGPLAPAQPPNRAEPSCSYRPSSPPLAGPDDGAIGLLAVKKSPPLTGGVINRTLKKVTHQLERFNHRKLFGLMGAAKCKQDDSAAACRSDGPLNGGPVAEARPSEPAANQCPTMTATLSESELKILSLRKALTATGGQQQQQSHHQAALALDRSSSSGQLRPSHHDSSLGLMSSDASLTTASSSATSSSRSIRDPAVLGGGRRGPHLEYRGGGKAATAAQQAFRYGPGRTGSIDYSSLLSFSADALERRQRFSSGIPSRDRTLAVGCGGVIGCEPRCHEACGGNSRAMDIEQKTRLTSASGKACGGGGGHLTDSGRSSTEINSSELETPSSSSKHSDEDEEANITLT
ncbi:uncharacterized protein LOC128270668 [Anopheles cruzii]|uniref:uncharacterized protein LOC128270668 n=1 Tax=Anopheles cruzii TaxID=68878 RepID=UPI0022EC457D|nr:uncharacterized protein LOC128270668 [Anopheles cruzii]